MTRCSSGHPTIAVELSGIADTWPTMLGVNPWWSWLRCFIVAITYPPYDQGFLKTQWYPWLRPAMKAHFLSGVRLGGRGGWPAMSLKLRQSGPFLTNQLRGFIGDYDPVTQGFFHKPLHKDPYQATITPQKIGVKGESSETHWNKAI